ncbi:hypothetical protein ABTX81_17565 [Kitasatospora sp. NPDC097605]|uniref:hypothetical protein n=1 Tax=Kitasatospora sp. NPDC097605 TaxID=3157226 RepID=UPI003333CC98
MPVEEEFEAEFARALRGAAALAPDDALFGLAAGAERWGRRRRGRRRAALVGGVAAVVLVAGGAGVLGGGAGAGLFGPAAAPVRPMTAEEVVRLVTGLLPPGSVESKFAEAPGDSKASRGEHQSFGALEFDDGKGASVITFGVERGTQRPDEAARCSDPFTTPQDSCERTERPDGSVVVIDKRRDSSFPEQRQWQATWAAPDGTVVRITEYNGQPAARTRDEPPLDAGQLAAMVTSPAWARVVAAMPPNPKAPKAPEAPEEPTPAPATPPAAELLATLTRLLPPGTTASGPDEQHTTLTVTAGERTSRVSVLVEPAGAQGRQGRKGVEEGLPTPLEVREKLPDGTLVVTNRFGNGKTATDPLLHWTAQVYYPDGRSVQLYEWNGENGYDFRPGEPALSVDQLKAVVLAPDWRK